MKRIKSKEKFIKFNKFKFELFNNKYFILIIYKLKNQLRNLEYLENFIFR